MTANSAKQADGRFLHSILFALIIAAVASGAVAGVSIAKSQAPGKAAIESQP